MALTHEDKQERQARRYLAEIGESEAVARWIGNYNRPNTRCAYLRGFSRYLGYVASQGVTMTPDELCKDNLVSVFKSDPVDVLTKRKHVDWLSGCVNGEMLKEGYSDSERGSTVSAVTTFYRLNDSPLWGAFKLVPSPAKEEMPALHGRDVAKVLKLIPVAFRTPLIITWQSGIEVNRVLTLRWKTFLDPKTGEVKDEYPLQIRFPGRKNQKHSYHTYIGRDAIEHLKVWRKTWEEEKGRAPKAEDYVFLGKSRMGDTLISDMWLNIQLKRAASRLFSQGLIKTGEPEAWRTHKLRHSFETEASHAGINAELRDFFEGHTTGVQWVYNHRDEVHPEDMAKAWLKVEPLVSLDYNEKILRAEFDDERKRFEEEKASWQTQFMELRKIVQEEVAARKADLETKGVR